MASRLITSEAELREIIGSPAPLITAKISDRLNDLTRFQRSALPSGCAILRQLKAAPELDAVEYDRERAARYARREGLY